MSRGLAAENGFHRSRAWVEEIGLEEAAAEIRKRTVERIGDFDENFVLIDGSYDRMLPPEIQREYTSRRLGIIAVEAAAPTRVFKRISK